jgi:hypothetical protein
MAAPFIVNPPSRAIRMIKISGRAQTARACHYDAASRRQLRTDSGRSRGRDGIAKIQAAVKKDSLADRFASGSFAAKFW